MNTTDNISTYSPLKTQDKGEGKYIYLYLLGPFHFFIITVKIEC